METQEEIIAAARVLGEALQRDMTWTSGPTTAYWRPSKPQDAQLIESRATAALEFLRVHAGEQSFWTTRAVEALDSGAQGRSRVSGARTVGEIILQWADALEAGRAEIVGAASSAEIAVSTDIMGQVRALIEDKTVHPAAPIMLCGAALEVALRAAVDAHALAVNGRPSMASYAEALRTGGVFDAQDVKDVTSVAGLRNSAAHGHFDELSSERAGLMEQQTNLLLRRTEAVSTPIPSAST